MEHPKKKYRNLNDRVQRTASAYGQSEVLLYLRAIARVERTLLLNYSLTFLHIICDYTSAIKWHAIKCLHDYVRTINCPAINCLRLTVPRLTVQRLHVRTPLFYITPGQFWGYCSAGVTRCSEIWCGFLKAKSHTNQCTGVVWGWKRQKILPNFY